MTKTMRRRTASTDDVAVLRAADETGDESLTFRGHAAVFNQPTLIGTTRWGFVEWIEPGAFRSVLNDDARYLLNHDGMPLARTTNKTLRLSEDKIGLVAEADLAPVQLSRDLATLIERGDITQMSFAFYPGEERVGTINLKERAKDGLPDGILDDWDGLPYRAVTTMERLFDVSAVTYPAYEGTDAAMVSKKIEAEVRSFMDEFQKEFGYEPKYSATQRAATLRAYKHALFEA